MYPTKDERTLRKDMLNKMIVALLDEEHAIMDKIENLRLEFGILESLDALENRGVLYNEKG